MPEQPLRDTCAESIRLMHPLFQEGQGGSTPTSALGLWIEEIEMRQAMELNAVWHSILPRTHYAALRAGNHTVCYGAVADGRCFAIAIWSDPVNRSLNDGTRIELRRLAIAPDAPRFTASRMLAVMVRLLHRKFTDITTAVSYQAVAYHSGTIYRAAGWERTSFVKFTPWKKRKTRTRDGKFQHKSSDRSPPQIESDKWRWEKSLIEAQA